QGLAAALYLDYKTYLADDILALSDRLSMAHSLEIRVPLVDHVLAEQVFPLPAHFKVRSWQLKPLLKRALASRIPAAPFTAPKRLSLKRALPLHAFPGEGEMAVLSRHDRYPLLEEHGAGVDPVVQQKHREPDQIGAPVQQRPKGGVRAAIPRCDPGVAADHRHGREHPSLRTDDEFRMGHQDVRVETGDRSQGVRSRIRVRLDGRDTGALERHAIRGLVHEPAE